MKLSEDPLYVDAMTCLFKGEYAQARDKLMICSESTQDDVWKAFFRRVIAESFRQEHRLSDAMSEINKAVKIDPSPLSLVKKAEFACLFLKDFSVGSAAFVAALQKGKVYADPTFDELRFRRQTLRRMQELGIDTSDY